MKIALCTELRNVEWFESRLRSLFDGDGQLAIDELWNENQLAQSLCSGHGDDNRMVAASPECLGKLVLIP